jgi:hypothetical protein
MLHDQEAMVFLLQHGHELEESIGAAHFQRCVVAVQPIGDARVVAADEEDLVAPQFEVAVEASQPTGIIDPMVSLSFSSSLMFSCKLG